MGRDLEEMRKKHLAPKALSNLADDEPVGVRLCGIKKIGGKLMTGIRRKLGGLGGTSTDFIPRNPMTSTTIGRFDRLCGDFANFHIEKNQQVSAVFPTDSIVFHQGLIKGNKVRRVIFYIASI